MRTTVAVFAGVTAFTLTWLIVTMLAIHWADQQRRNEQREGGQK